MPTSLQLHLTGERRPRQPTAAQLHGAFSSLFDADEVTHRAQDKPWAIRSPVIRDGELVLRGAWFGAPTHALGGYEGGALRLGGARYTVDRVELRQVTRSELAALPMERCDLRFESPTWFSRNGRRYPLPDPALAYLSLARRWALGATERDGVPDALLDELLDCLVLRAFDGRTEVMDLGGRIRVGFVGNATIGLTGACGAEARHVFGALTRFAEYGGIGAETSWGAGSVSVLDWQ